MSVLCASTPVYCNQFETTIYHYNTYSQFSDMTNYFRELPFIYLYYNTLVLH